MAEQTDRRESRIEEGRSTTEGMIANVKETVSETVGTVKETVEQAKSTVGNLVENVTGTIDSTTAAVRQSFDLQHQVSNYPWLTFGGAVLTGYVLGSWTRLDSPYRRNYRNLATSYEYDDDDSLYAAGMSGGATLEDIETQGDAAQKGYAYPPHRSETHDQPDRADRTSSYEKFRPARPALREQFQEEWNIVKGVAVDTLMDTVRTMVRQQMPALAPHLDSVFDRVSAKLANNPPKPAQGQPMPDTTQSHPSENVTPYTAASAETPSSSQGSGDHPSATDPQPRPYTQYRR
jgi:hypothetical protein